MTSRRASLLAKAPVLLAVTLFAAALALGTHFVLKILYGVPAPAAVMQESTAQTSPQPHWLAGSEVGAFASLILVGVVAQGAKSSLALVQEAGASAGRAKVYRIGQTLPNGAVLTSVTPRSATLDNQGNVQTLQLDLNNTANASNPAINQQKGVVQIMQPNNAAAVQQQTGQQFAPPVPGAEIQPHTGVIRAVPSAGMRRQYMGEPPQNNTP